MRSGAAGPHALATLDAPCRMQAGCATSSVVQSGGLLHAGDKDIN